MHSRTLLPALLLAAAIAHRADAQSLQIRPFAQFEGRADAILGSPSAFQLGLGGNIPVDPYVRLGATVAGGSLWQNGRGGASARTDITARYLLDPYSETRWGDYGGGGLSARWDEDARWRTHWRTYLLLVGGIEGPAHHGWRTAFEFGVGGGARIGIVLRRARQNWR